KEEQFKQIEKYMQVDKTATESAETKEMNEFLKDKPELSDLLTNITDAPFKAFPCRYEHLHFDKGKMHMDGETALKFVRSRHSLQDGTDFARGRRQQRLLLAVKEKVLSIAFLPKIIPLMESLQDDIQMDLSVTDIKNLLAESNNSKNYKIINLVLSDENYLQSSYSENGQSILIEKSGNNNTGQDWIDIRKWIQESLAGITPTPEITKSRVPIKER
ncbi:MAG TPA: LCP family protein, partial [Candidatus Nitrosocosmicus sp.]|nr:LCP family protein [Candidatus Nitrosocosmicus sp.]